MIEDLRLRNVDNSTTHIRSTVIASDVTEDNLSGLRSDHWITASSSEYLITIRSNPRDVGRIEELFHWIGRAVENSGLPTTIT